MIKKILLIFCMVLLLGSVSAFEFDNRVTKYDKENEEITITNIYGVGSKLAIIKLVDYEPYCIPNNCFLNMEIEVLKGSLRSYKSSKYYNWDQTSELKNKERLIEIYNPDKEIEQTYYTKSCTPTIIDGNATETCEEVENTRTIYGGYEVYDPSTKLAKGTYRLREKVDINAGETVDLVPNFYGIDLVQWVDFTGSTKIEFYDTNDDAENGVRGARSLGQTFTTNTTGPGGNFTVTGFAILADLGASNAANYTTYAYIAEANASGAPTGAVIASTIFNNSNFSVGTPEWLNFTFDILTGTLYEGTTYGFYMNTTLATQGVSDDLEWRWDQTNPTYTGGNATVNTGAAKDDWVLQAQDFMFELWGTSLFEVASLSPADNYVSSSRTVGFNCSAKSGVATVTNISLWTNNTGTYEENNITTGLSDFERSVNMTYQFSADGDYNWSCYGCNNNSQCNYSDVRIVTIDTSAPAVTITYPTSIVGYQVIGQNMTLNWTVTDGNLQACWYDYNGTNNTITCSANTTQFNFTDYNDRNLTFYANDTGGLVNSTIVAWNFTLFETNLSYNATTQEMDRENFVLNFTYNSALWSDVLVNLVYNGTKYVASESGTGDEIVASRSIDIPTYSGTVARNFSFYWEFILSNATGSYYYNSTFNNQTADPVVLIRCNSTYPSPIIVNYTIYDEDSRNSITASMDASFTYWLGDGVTSKNFSLDSSDFNSTFQFCTNINDTFYVNAILNLENTSYNERTYQLLNQTYTNITTEKFLYMLNSGNGTDVIVEVTDPGLSPLSGYSVVIERYYPETASYNEIFEDVTDEYGQVVPTLIENDIKYRFTFKDSDGTTVKTTGDMTIACRATICVLPFVIEDTEDDFERFSNDTDLDWTLTFNNNTNIFTFSWNDNTGDVASYRLYVQRILFNGSTLVCNTSTTANSGSLTCDTSSITGSYICRVYRTVSGDESILAVLNAKVGETFKDYGREGLIWTFLLLLTMLAIGSFNPPLGVVLYNVGFIIMGLLGVVQFTLPIFFATNIIMVLFIWAYRA